LIFILHIHIFFYIKNLRIRELLSVELNYLELEMMIHHQN